MPPGPTEATQSAVASAATNISAPFGPRATNAIVAPSAATLIAVPTGPTAVTQNAVLSASTKITAPFGTTATNLIVAPSATKSIVAPAPTAEPRASDMISSARGQSQSAGLVH